nr:immunoglobulin heavy chain junction region [Mus musculus]
CAREGLGYNGFAYW